MKDHVEFFRTWAKDLRCAHGNSADADLMDAAMDDLEGLRARAAKLEEAIKPFASIPPVCLSALDGAPLYAAHYWCVVGRPDKTHFTREDLARARDCLGLEVALFKAVSAASGGGQDPSEEDTAKG